MQTRITSDMTLSDLLALKKTIPPGRITLQCDDGKVGTYDRGDIEYFVGINGTITTKRSKKANE